jgi:hypothetical protein
MNHERYLAYRSAARSLAQMPLDHHERERLRDTAEGLLLTTDPDDAEPLRSDAALALSLLVGQQRLDDLIADVLWQGISDCGPAASRRARRPRGLSFAGSL